MKPVALIGDGLRVITALGNIGEHCYNLTIGDVRDVEAAIADLASVTADLGSAGKVGGRYITQLTGALGGAEIIASAITVVDYCGQTAGFGSPDRGGGLTVGANHFETVSGHLNSAIPDTGWHGFGADAYADRNADLLNRAQVLAALDRQLAELVDDQAQWVVHARLALAAINNGLVMAMAIALAIAAWERTNPFAAPTAAAAAASRNAMQAWNSAQTSRAQAVNALNSLRQNSGSLPADIIGAKNKLRQADDELYQKFDNYDRARREWDYELTREASYLSFSRWFQRVVSVVGIGSAAAVLLYLGACCSRINSEQAILLIGSYDLVT